jgi:hypothetical protein
MTVSERFKRVFSFQRPDRLPAFEWASWWDLTVRRWLGEGLGELEGWGGDSGDTGAIAACLALDVQRQSWIASRAPECPEPASEGAPLVRTASEYRELLPLLYPRRAFDPAVIESHVREREEGRSVFWITLEGFFWHPRTLFGIEGHLYAFHLEPELMREMNDRLADFHLRALDEVCRIGVPDFMTFAEDVSYNKGPMISGGCFEEFLAPYYRRVVPELKRRGIRVFVDSDGDVTAAVPWFAGAGVEGILPLERQSGVDVSVLRERHPGFLFIGGFDKRVMKDGENAIRGELDRLLPAMRSGGFVPSVDHQTPPDVSLSTYRCYVRLLHEYCERAVSA